MSQTDLLREQIIDKIFNIDNEAFLEALNTLISKDQQKTHFDADQLEMIEQSLRDIQSGNTISNDSFQEEVSKWLKEKGSTK